MFTALLWKRFFIGLVAIGMALCGQVARSQPSPTRSGPPDPLAPRGKIHVPIGIADTVDTLKTFVEAEGDFSPGCGSYGVYFWVFDPAANKLTAPTMNGVPCERGFPPEGFLLPWSRWTAGDLVVKTAVCQVKRTSPAGDVMVVGATVDLCSTASDARRVSLFAALRPLGPAGFAVNEISVSGAGDAIMVDGHAAIVGNDKPAAIGVSATDAVGQLATTGRVPTGSSARSAGGDCSGALRYDVTIPKGESVRLGFVCPVLPGRRAVGHDWDGHSTWAQLDLQSPNPAKGGVLQPDPGIEYYRAVKAAQLFTEADSYWRLLAGRVKISVPDPRWAQAFGAILGHAAMAMNEGAPDVTVINYNVFNRDGVYVANILQKAGCFDLSARAIDYFLRHPFNGRTSVEADNPGQVLWAIGQHWRFSRDRDWLQRVYPSAAKIAAMIRYYRTAPPPHFVKADSLEFGNSLPPDRPDDKPANRRQTLRPGSCDGTHPEYTEAFDIAGLRAAAILARAMDKPEDARVWETLAAKLMESYNHKYSGRLAAGYGSYCVLWPCNVYPYTQGRAHETFCKIGAQRPAGWRYFPLATAHQGLLAGNRSAGHETIETHLDHEQCRGWYAFDEGGGSGPGGWPFYRTTWNPGVAMPHGWAIAELFLLIRDSLLFEDGDRLVLLGGVSPDWLRHRHGIALENVPTWFGSLSVTWTASEKQAALSLSGPADPPGGYVLRLPPGLASEVSVGGKVIVPSANGDCLLPPGTKSAVVAFR